MIQTATLHTKLFSLQAFYKATNASTRGFSNIKNQLSPWVLRGRAERGCGIQYRVIEPWAGFGGAKMRRTRDRPEDTIGFEPFSPPQCYGTRGDKR